MNVGMHYTWKDKKFTRRKNNLYSIGRVYTVHPKDIEKFYLRLLLHKIPGPTCYEDLRTVNGRLCETFQEACQELGLLECDNHWDMALTEATETAVPRKIRDLFAIILTFGIPSGPKDLWIKHRDSMSEDYLHLIRETKSQNLGPSTSSSQDELNEALDKQKAINMALIYIEDKCIEIQDMRLCDYGLESPDRSQTIDINMNQQPKTSIDPVLIEQQKLMLNDNQQEVFDIIMTRIQSGNGGIMFLDAPGGTGKTFLINLIISECMLQNKTPIAVASSGTNSFMVNSFLFINKFHFSLQELRQLYSSVAEHPIQHSKSQQTLNVTVLQFAL